MGKKKADRARAAKRPLTPRERLFAAIAATLGIVGAFAIAEIALRLADFNPARVNPGYLQFGYRTGMPQFDEDGLRREGEPVQVRLFRPDPEVLWTTIPNTPFTNSRGFRGKREYTEAKPPGTIRILFIGDSCTFLGDPVYPEIVERELAARFPDKKIECLNAAVPGYSSFQGSKLIARLEIWQPDFVSVYFGWNDHWPAQGGLTDRIQYSAGHGLRLLTILEAWRARGRRDPINRVPLPEFEENLESIRRAVASWPTRVVLVTAPTAFRAGAMPDWSYDFFGEYYHMQRTAIDSIPAQHSAYADGVRRVASNAALLVDEEKDFREAGLASDEYFRTDSIHLLTPGHERIGRAVAAAVAETWQAGH